MSNTTSTSSNRGNRGTRTTEQTAAAAVSAANAGTTVTAATPVQTAPTTVTVSDATDEAKRGRKPADQQSEADKARYAAITLSWGKVAVFMPDGSLDETLTIESFKKAMEAYKPYAHVSRTGGPKEYLSVEDAQKLAPLARAGYDKGSKPTPDYGRVVNMHAYVDGCYQAMGFDAFADDKDAVKDKILNTLCDKLGYERVKVASLKKPGTMELSSGSKAMIRRIPTEKKS